MRRTIRFDRHLLERAKAHAARTGGTLTALIEDALRQALQRRPASGQRPRINVRTFKGAGLRQGVDL